MLEELRHWQTKRGAPEKDTPDSDPRPILATTITYLENNQDRMKYPEYRQPGLPVTTAWMESLVKEINYRVKGTEMFWNDPEGAEAILQVRAAALCDDERLAKHLRTRAGAPSPAAQIPKVKQKKQKLTSTLHGGRWRGFPSSTFGKRVPEWRGHQQACRDAPLGLGSR